MSGEMTTVSPDRAKDGNWKQSDFPPPVGSSANTSFPASASRIISSCNGRNDVKPKYCFRSGRSGGAWAIIDFTRLNFCHPLRNGISQSWSSIWPDVEDGQRHNSLGIVSPVLLCLEDYYLLN